MRVALLYGGRSGEHEVSIRSARSIYSVLKNRHEVFPIFIDKDGSWWRVDESRELPSSCDNLTDKIFIYPGVTNAFLYTSRAQLKIDIVFPVLHGTHGEDGIIQGVLETIGIPYVGANVSASAAGMDKVIMKALFVQGGLPVVPYVWFSRRQWRDQESECIAKVESLLKYPIFVKPANLGSSVGISKAHDREDMKKGFENAARYDFKILLEQGIDGRELECSVLGNEEPEASLPGEVVPKREFYDYIAKYIEESTELHIPANLRPEQVQKVKDLSVRAFRAIGCSGMARVDLFMERKTGILYVNEINTIPGFTNISMYPKLWEVSGLAYSDLLDRLLQLGLERFREQAENLTSYDAFQIS
jgi:D-alanine-D-alanine ligase